MKKLITLILFMFGISYASVSAAQNVSLELSDEPEKREISTAENISGMIAIWQHFDKGFPGDKIDSEEFEKEFAKAFPTLKGRALYSYMRDLKDAIKFYRLYQELKQQIMEKIIAPEPPILVVEDDQYETEDTGEYIESKDLVVIEDFKKVISYSSNLKEKEAYFEKKRRDDFSKISDSEFDKMAKVFSKLEFKKLPFYGVIYEDPIAGKLGCGAWKNQEGNKARLIAENTAIGNKTEFIGAVHFALPDDTLLSASDNFGLDCKNSKNLKDITYYMPVPAKLKNYVGYGGNFAIPLKFGIKDKTKDLDLSCKVIPTICKADGCRPVNFDLFLHLGANKESFQSTVSNFIVQSYAALPEAENENITIKKAVLEGDVLKVAIRFKKELYKNMRAFAVPEKETFFKPEGMVKKGDVFIFNFKTNMTPGTKKVAVIAQNGKDAIMQKIEIAPTGTQMDYEPKTSWIMLRLFAYLLCIAFLVMFDRGVNLELKNHKKDKNFKKLKVLFKTIFWGLLSAVLLTAVFDVFYGLAG